MTADTIQVCAACSQQILSAPEGYRCGGVVFDICAPCARRLAGDPELALQLAHRAANAVALLPLLRAADALGVPQADALKAATQARERFPVGVLSGRVLDRQLRRWTRCMARLLGVPLRVFKAALCQAIKETRQ